MQSPADPKHPEAGSVRQSLEALEEAGLGRDKQLDSVRIPNGFEYLWELFWRVLRGCASGYSGSAITWSEIAAYESVTRERLDAFEVEALMAMSTALRAS